MNLKITLFVLILFISNNLFAQKSSVECLRKAPFGDIKICLPAIDNMTECYLNATINQRANQFNYEGNSILAYYIPNEAYKEVETMPVSDYKDYFQIYATNSLKDKMATKTDLKEMKDIIKNTFTNEIWETAKEKIESKHGIEVGKPIVIEDFKITDEAYGFIMLTKYGTGSDEMIMMMIMDMILIENRMIWIAYYQKYSNDSIFKPAKEKNNLIVSKIIKANK